VAYVLAVGAALSNALTSIFQRMGVEDAPPEASMRLSLIAFALRRAVWLAGFGMMICGFLLQFSALHFGQLSTVQPMLTLELPFLVAILGVWFRKPIGPRDAVGVVMATGGLACFLWLARASGGHLVPSLVSWGEVGFASLATIVVAVALAHVGSRGWRAAMFGLAGAVAFAFSAALIKVMNTYISRNWAHLFLHWQPYALACTGLVGMFLAQNAFHAGPITASQATLVIVDPLASILIGIGLFGDRFDTAGPRGVLESLALLTMFVGVGVLASSPLVAGVKGEAGREAERLSRARERTSTEEPRAEEPRATRIDTDGAPHGPSNDHPHAPSNDRSTRPTAATERAPQASSSDESTTSSDESTTPSLCTPRRPNAPSGEDAGPAA
jgi:drug/metabolite transporter (DMT)-like permease